ncbi:hypothetical protein [Paenibacillus sp. IHBB 10380]|uniref:hypothetical protein n=1 Tax=Paenibacillus sp. IHBB 10380 TaxID=1566358 RepID=UPI0005CFE2AD|nr:hypothetical protein [Paenibacillus sp. IHBB 10380]AJS61035.1 hypothetical protein UB51_24230 [Paenibacillus sp. IHBB 10380]
MDDNIVEGIQEMNIDDLRDDLLATLVFRSNNETLDLDLTVTLTVGGTLISGKLVSGKTYCDGVAGMLNNTGMSGRRLSEFFTDFGKERYADNDGDYDEDGEIQLPSYIHLKDARVIVGNLNLGWWRGKLTSINGFTIGEIYNS